MTLKQIIVIINIIVMKIIERSYSHKCAIAAAGNAVRNSYEQN